MEKMNSRKEKRKMARQEKKQHKHQALLQHHQKKLCKSKPKPENMKMGGSREGSVKDNVRIENVRRNPCMRESDNDSDREGDYVKPVFKSKMTKRDHINSDSKRTKFEEYLEMDMKVGPSMEEDLEMERRLAKKLKLKKGKLDDGGDGLDDLFEGIPSFNHSYGQEYDICEGNEVDGLLESSEKRKSNRRKEGNSEQDDGASCMNQAQNMSLGTNAAVLKDVQNIGKFIVPHKRPHSGDDLQDYIQIRRRVRGLLNRMSESNVESITGEIFSLFQSVSRAVTSQIISEEVLASCARGPRGNEQYAAVFAAFVAGMACMIGIDCGARVMESFAKSFEDEYSKEDSISLRNLMLLLSYLCIFGVCSSDLIYDFLIKLSKQLAEIDVSTILTILQCCGMKLRGDDPASMKDFILSVQSRVSELKATLGDADVAAHSKRMEFMLETICDIKNNKKRANEDSSPHTRIKKWLQKLRIEDITLRGLKWNKLLDPKKKGQWWISGDITSRTEDAHIVAGKMDKEVNEAQKMLELAAKQRMNTDTRRAIFCVIMSGEDYVDAFEQLLSMNLQGKQDREIMRVLVECCLQEKMFNKYYTALASKLCSHDKNHKFTLQYCLWDHLKELESMPLMRSMHLAKFVAEMLASFTLSLAVLKVVDLIDASQLTAKRIMHFRMLFEALFGFPDNVVWNVFTRVAITPELEELRNGLEFFIREYVITINKDVAKRLKLVKKALNNAEGVLM